jgi:Alpha/beta hydrolase family
MIQESLLLRVALLRAVIAALAISGMVMPAWAHPVDAAAARIDPAPANIVIGFVGGFVAHDSPHHGPVQLAQQIRRSVSKDTYVRVFENRHRKQAYADVARLLDTNHDGILSAEEKSRARIILFGHSWGASAAVLLARDLDRQGVPVLLTVQVDSVAKAWQNDSIIPDNVAQAVNFYQTQGILHGQPRITAANPAKTQILGNYLMDYKKAPVECPEASWWDHVFTPGHMQSECDPHLWLQIEEMVKLRLSSPETSQSASAAGSFAAQAQH